MFSKPRFVLFSLASIFYLCDAGKKPDNPPLGGWSTVPANDSNVRRVADVGLNLLNENINSKYGLKLIGISSAKSQVVSGINYRITSHIGHCRSAGECEFHKTQNCTMILWEQAWLNSTRLTKYECSKAKFSPLYKSPVMVPGGVAPTDRNDTELLKAAKFVEEELKGRAGQNFKINVKKIYEATQQVVSGMKYTMIAQLLIKDTISASNKANGKTTCLLNVLSQGWKKPQYELLAYECDSQKHNAMFSLTSVTPV